MERYRWALYGKVSPKTKFRLRSVNVHPISGSRWAEKLRRLKVARGVGERYMWRKRVGGGRRGAMDAGQRVGGGGGG